MLKISAVFLIGKAEICQDPPSWGQDDQTLCQKSKSKKFVKKFVKKIHQKIRQKVTQKNRQINRQTK